MDIEGERKSQRRRKRDSGRGIERQDGDIGKNEGKGEVVSLPIVGVRRRKRGREKERERRVAYNRGSEGATRK